jgi:hypothetical protein
MAKDNWANILNLRRLATFTMFARQFCRKAIDPMGLKQRIPTPHAQQTTGTTQIGTALPQPAN